MYLYKKIVSTPVGHLTLVSTNDALCAVLWENDDPDRVRLNDVRPREDHPILMAAERQLQEYFAGTRRKFELRLEFITGTPFQRKVWRELLSIPYGTTVSYGELAQQIGSPRAYRAVGAANGRNPISIIAPCHRVIGGNGKLTGFAGGLAAKEKLLNLES